MDPITRTVREFYEQYPYPSGPPVMREGFDARLALSYGALERPAGRPIRVLDAGCGRAVGLVAAASLQPDVEFLGADLNRVALEDARREAERLGLENVRFEVIDLMSLEGLEAPEGGFDVIHSSGVIHHLSDPEEGLENLAGVLAPHGVLQLMVYSRQGREHIHPVARAIELLSTPGMSTGQRLSLGRDLTEAIADRHGDEGWGKAAATEDVEFVDRYLHPQEASYDVASLWDLFESAGLEFLRWNEPDAWDVASDLGQGALLERAKALPPREQFRLMSEFRRGGKLQLMLCKPGNSVRPDLDLSDVPDAALAVHPEGTFEVSTRSLWGSTRIEQVAWRLVRDDAEPFPRGPLATAALILRDQNEPFRGHALIGALVEQGVSEQAAQNAVFQLLGKGVLYRPHEVELPSAVAIPA